MNRSLTGTELKRLHREWRKRPKGKLSIIVHGIQGPFNIGAIIRSAAAERVDHIWFSSNATTPANPKVGKTALGSERYIEWQETSSPFDAIDDARSRGYRIIALELTTEAIPLPQIDLHGNICLVIGHEDRGLDQEILNACDVSTFIPQLGKVGSLNVAVATAIAIYEVRRQGWSLSIQPETSKPRGVDGDT
jgi:tRNA (guanosine-2'-O-)-methyltransferase